MQSNDTQINFNELREHTVESLMGRFKEFQRYLDVEAPGYHYKLKKFLFNNTRAELIGLELLKEQHLFGESERLDEAGINYPQFAFDTIQYGYKRTKRMWTVIESMKLNDEQRAFADDLYRFALDLSLDVTVSNAISFTEKAIQIRFCEEIFDDTDDYSIIHSDGLRLKFCSYYRSFHRLVKYISVVLELEESWFDESNRLVEILIQHYNLEYVSSILVGNGRMVVTFE